MKKWLCFLMIGVLLQSLIACDNKPALSYEQSVGDSSTTISTKEQAPSLSEASGSVYLAASPDKSAAYNEAITAYNAFLNGQIAAKAEDNSKQFILGYSRISDGKSGIDRYALRDVNNDGVPELFIDAAIDHILAFDGENIAQWYSSMSWMGIQLLKNGAVVDTHSGAGSFINYLTFGPDGIEKFISFSGGPGGESGQYYYGEGKSEPSQKVSKDQWEVLTKPYFQQMENKAELEWHCWYP